MLPIQRVKIRFFKFAKLFFGAYLNGVRFTSTHVQFVVAHTQGQNPLINSQTWGKKDEIGRLSVDGFNNEFPIVEGNISDFRPGEPDFGRQPVVLLVDVEPEGVHAQPQFSA